MTPSVGRPMSRACKGTTKKGAPCKANPLHDGDYCLAHDKEARESASFGGSQPNAGRPRVPRVTEVQRELVMENAVAMLTPHFRTLGYDIVVGEDGKPVLVEREGGGAKLYGTSKDGYVNVSGHDDLGAMLAAAEKLLDRVVGRPRQAVEHSGPEGGPIRVDGDVDLSRLSPAQLEQLRGLLEEAAPDG